MPRMVLPDGTLFGEGIKTRIKEVARNLQPAHHRPPAQRRLQSLHRHQDQPAVLHQGHADAGRLVLRASLSAGREKLQQDQADAASKSSRLKRHGGTTGSKTNSAWKVSAADIKARNYNLDIKNPHSPDAVAHDPDELLADYAQLQQRIAKTRDQLKAVFAAALEGTA